MANKKPSDEDIATVMDIGTYFLGAWSEAMSGRRGENWDQEAAEEAASQFLVGRYRRVRAKGTLSDAPGTINPVM